MIERVPPIRQQFFRLTFNFPPIRTRASQKNPWGPTIWNSFAFLVCASVFSGQNIVAEVSKNADIYLIRNNNKKVSKLIFETHWMPYIVQNIVPDLQYLINNCKRYLFFEVHCALCLLRCVKRKKITLQHTEYSNQILQEYQGKKNRFFGRELSQVSCNLLNYWLSVDNRYVRQTWVCPLENVVI